MIKSYITPFSFFLRIRYFIYLIRFSLKKRYSSGLRGQTANLLFVGSNPTLFSKGYAKAYPFFVFIYAGGKAARRADTRHSESKSGFEFFYFDFRAVKLD